MTATGPGTGAESSPFTQLMDEVMATADRFGHRQHVHLTWLAVRRHGTAAAVDLIGDGIRRTARYAGVPQKYRLDAGQQPAGAEPALVHVLPAHRLGRAGDPL
ncbi:hypothetical protein, partial [Kitasatospora sp. NPDC007106]|uniref:hypothetical protein n=1 Tax=Kitasatospora sp. NPDC007106 TaxID=3156914 RepID=UPI003403D719